MALVATLCTSGAVGAIVEDADHIHILGHAYTKDTLTPVFGRFSFYYTYTSQLRLPRYCAIPDSTSLAAASWDSTIADPGGLLTNHSVIQAEGAYFLFANTQYTTTWSSNGNRLVYQKLDSTKTSLASYSASELHMPIPVGYIASLNAIVAISAEGYYGPPATVPQIVRYPTGTLTAPTTIRNSAGYGYATTLLSENATYWFIAELTGNGGTTSTCCLSIQAINKTSAAATQVLAATNQSTTFPRLLTSNAYSQSTDSKWTYMAGANSADPYFTVRYNNYNQSTLGNTGGDCTIDWNGSSSAEFSAIAKTSALSKIRTWVVTGTADSFVYFAVMDEGSSTTQTVANMKMYGFKISSGTPSSIQFKETIAIGTAHGRIRNVFPITNNWRTIAVMTDSAATLYTWDDTNGYTVGTSISYSIKHTNPTSSGTFGVDEEGRIWIHSAGGSGSTLSVYSPTVATTVTLTFAASSYNYSGTTINSSFNLSAYNSSGARIATDIQVVFDSANCTFSDDTTTKTITTSAAGETSTNIKIIAPGQIRAVANVAV